MTDHALAQQNILLQNRERIMSEITTYPNVVMVGVGLKEVNNELTSILCYRVYVNEKKSADQLAAHEIIPGQVEGFITDVIPYGIVEEISMDNKPYRPVKGGIQIKNDLYVDNKTRGGGTLGCLVISNDDPDTILGLTNEHVVSWNSEDVPDGVNDIGQPWKRTCCCIFVRDVIGSVFNSQKDDKVDCAVIEFHSDILSGIKNGGTINEIHEVGAIKGKTIAVAGMLVKKRGAATGLTHGIVKDVAFDQGQLLIGPVDPYVKFADFGDSGSIVLDENNLVIGLLWAAERNRFRIPGEPIIISSNLQDKIDPRIHGVATPIALVEAAMEVKIPVPPVATPTFAIHSDDTKTHAIPSILPVSQNPKIHFVTVKGEGDIIIKVSFGESIDPNRVAWVSDNPFMPVTSPAVGMDKLTAKIPRSTPRGMKASVGVTVDGLSVGERVLVWIIWSETKFNNLDKPFEVKIGQLEIKATRIFSVEYKLQPEGIIPANINQEDVPDLSGPNVSPPPNVPDTDTDVLNKGVDLAGSVKYKWDVTIALNYKIKNPNNFFIDPQLPFSKPSPNYPSLDTVGNFETSSGPFESDPYDELPHFRGTIGKTFIIEHTLPNSIAEFQGHNGDVIEFLLNHRSFARLELNGKWYLISDFTLGYVKLKYKVSDEFADHHDYDEDGDQFDTLWVGVEGVNDCFYFVGNSDF